MLELRYGDYLDKVHAGWIGKCIGGAIGYIQENNKSILSYTPETAFPDTIPANDDLDLQVLWLQELLEKRGSFFTERDLAEVFAKYNLLMSGEYAIAIRNIELGIAPPLSGSFNNSLWQHSMGCPIRSEIWGFICPGHPEAAAAYAWKDGIVDHVSESIYGEQFYAALEAMSFVETDLRRLIDTSLERYVPGTSKLHRALRHVIGMFDAGKEWSEARMSLLRKYGAADAADAVTNIGLTVMALLYGRGDFGRTMMLAVNCGYDTDCTAATAGAIMGVIGGTSAIPEWWRQKVGEDIVIGTVDIKRYSDKIVDLARDTCAAGLSLARDGVIDVHFTDIPEGVKPSLPLPEPSNPLTVDIAYDGLPSIGRGEPGTVELTVRNASAAAVSGVLTLTVPDHLEADLTEARLTVRPGGEVKTRLTFSVKADTRALPQKNIVLARFAGDDGRAAECRFGLSGAVRAKLIGPFWDDYDTAKFADNPYGEVSQKMNGIPDPHAMFNSFANIDKAYIEETDAGFDAAEGEYINLHEERIATAQFGGYAGPCCFYLVHDFLVPFEKKRAEMFVGSSDAYRVWLNGEVILEDKSSDMYMSFNKFFLNATYKEGLNRVVVKLIRKGDRGDFSYMMRSPSLGFRWFTDMEHIIEG